MRSLLVLLLMPCAVAAQDPVRVELLLTRADSLLGVGEIARAEALYYSVARQQTRHPAPRASLGTYLASRGAFRVGATLLGEALAFGADTAFVDARRVPVLQLANDWATLAALTASSLSGPERARVAWLAAAPPMIRGDDSVTVAFQPTSSDALGRFMLVIGLDTVATDLDPESDELVLGDHRAYAQYVELFGSSVRGVSTVAVLREARIGGLILERVPARLDARLGPQRARMGLSLLAALAPTVDADAGVMTLRRTGELGPMMGRARVAIVLGFPGVRVARRDRLVPIGSPAGRAVLATARWTLDLRHGELILETDDRSQRATGRAPASRPSDSDPERR